MQASYLAMELSWTLHWTIEVLSLANLMRKIPSGWQLNRFVTGGVNGGYDEQAMEDHMKAKSVKAELDSSPFPTSSLVFPGYSKVCHLAAELGFTVRRKQAFRDGNHRTALLAIIHFLAQYHLQLHNVNFVYIYKLLSARHLFVTAKEPSKVNENCLTVLQSAEGWDIATIELQAYLHRHVVKVSNASVDLQHQSESIRDLPFHLSYACTVSDHLARTRLEDALPTYRKLDRTEKLELISHVPLLHLGRPGKMDGRPLKERWRLGKRWAGYSPVR